jgi:hypothetical protein
LSRPGCSSPNKIADTTPAELDRTTRQSYARQQRPHPWSASCTSSHAVPCAPAGAPPPASAGVARWRNASGSKATGSASPMAPATSQHRLKFIDHNLHLRRRRSPGRAEAEHDRDRQRQTQRPLGKLQLAPSLIDYVLVHESAHITQPQHTSGFWATVERAMRDCERRKENLTWSASMAWWSRSGCRGARGGLSAGGDTPSNAPTWGAASCTVLYSALPE